MEFSMQLSFRTGIESLIFCSSPGNRNAVMVDKNRKIVYVVALGIFVVFFSFDVTKRILLKNTVLMRKYKAKYQLGKANVISIKVNLVCSCLSS